jgi:hypothetical protein
MTVVPLLEDRTREVRAPLLVLVRVGPRRELLVAEAAYVTGNYLDVVGARLVEGRLLTAADDRADAAPVIVVSRRWPSGSDRANQRPATGVGIPGTPTYSIVGVVADMRDRTLEADRDLRYYAPRGVAGPTGDRFVLRVGGEPAATAGSPASRRRIRSPLR